MLENFANFDCSDVYVIRLIGDGSPSEMDRKKKRREERGEKFKVEIALAAQISMKTLDAVLRGEISDKAQDALRVLDIVLRQHASRKYELVHLYLVNVLNGLIVYYVLRYNIFL